MENKIDKAFIFGLIKTNAPLNLAKFYFKNRSQVNRLVHFMYLSKKFGNQFKTEYTINPRTGIIQTSEGINIDFNAIDALIFFETFCFRIHDKPKIVGGVYPS